MRTVLFIPARYQSKRFPGKPLVPLTGVSGVAKSLIERSWNAAMAVKGVAEVYVLSDDARIVDAVAAFGGKALMTPDARNGTERCAHGVGLLENPADIVVNLQGDALLTPPDYVEALINTLGAGDVHMATPVLRAEAQLEYLIGDRAAGRIGATTAVFAANHDALYFSKEVLPFGKGAVFHHLGIYAYRPDALRAYAALPLGELEKREGLEQLRFLENGMRVRCVEVAAKGRAFWELNNPGDVAIIEGILRAEGIE